MKSALRFSNMRLMLGKQDVNPDDTPDAGPCRSHVRQNGFAIGCF